jgi:LPS sulfotransferase NodH
MNSEPSIIICATQRSGSTLLFDDIRNTYGYPMGNSEVLINTVKSGRFLDAWDDVWKRAFSTNAMGKYFIGNVMFHYGPIIDDCIAGRPERPAKDKHAWTFKPEDWEAFHNFFRDSIWIYLEREDVYAQAASMHMAEKSDFWTRQRGTPSEHNYSEPELEYNYARISRLYKGFVNEQQNWQKFFQHFRIDPIRFTYDMITSRYPEYLRPLLLRVDLQPKMVVPERRMIKTGGAVAKRLADRLREDLRQEVDPH